MKIAGVFADRDRFLGGISASTGPSKPLGCWCSAITQILITEAVVLERFPEIDSDARIREIELGSGAIKRLLRHRIAGHKERELLMPLASKRGDSNPPN